MENLRIGITGNIGVGKSTLTAAMQEPAAHKILLPHLPKEITGSGIHTYPEKFCTEVLDAFYSDPKQYAFMAQIEFLNGRLERQRKINQVNGIILEDRTLFEDYHIFGKAQKISGNMTQAEFLTYQRNYNLMIEKIDEPDLIVYLRADVDTLIKRIKHRGRESEQNIPREYLELLNSLYESYISQHVMCPVLIIDANDEAPMADFLEATIKKVSAKIHELNLRVTTSGIREWVTMSETAAAMRVIEAERRLEEYLHEKPRLITVAGNVGLGKSTLAALMHQSLRIKALYEVPERNPLLEKFLNNKKKYCYDLQRHFLKLRAEQRRQAKESNFSYVKDRSFAEDLLIFSRDFHQNGILSSKELDLLEAEFHSVNRTLPTADLLILLQGKTDLAWSRIQQRGREMEMNGGWKYGEINSLNRLYKTYAEDVQRTGFHKGPVVVLDMNQIDLTNRVHMGYVFEQTYKALVSCDEKVESLVV